MAWLWGHEHRLVVYQPKDDWVTHGMCIGHGAIPELSSTLYNPVNHEHKIDKTYTPPPEKVNGTQIHSSGFAMLKASPYFSISLAFFKPDFFFCVCVL